MQASPAGGSSQVYGNETLMSGRRGKIAIAVDFATPTSDTWCETRHATQSVDLEQCTLQLQIASPINNVWIWSWAGDYEVKQKHLSSRMPDLWTNLSF